MSETDKAADDVLPCPFCGAAPDVSPASGGPMASCDDCMIDMLVPRWNCRDAAHPQDAESQWPDPLTRKMAQALEQHRESLPVEIMSMFDQMQRELDYARSGKLGPVLTPPPDAEMEALARQIAQQVVPYDAHGAGHSQSDQRARRAAKEAVRTALRARIATTQSEVQP